MTNETATSQVERACELRRRDRLAHLWADMAVAMAMEEMRKDNVDPDRRPLRFAADVATLATTILIDKLINDDQAIATLRAQMEEYKRQLDQVLRIVPPSIQIKTITGDPL
jgi:hypothetical protein